MTEEAVIKNFLAFGSVLVVPNSVDKIRAALQKGNIAFYEKYQSHIGCVLFLRTPYNPGEGYGDE
jgi:hypothetical protein